MSELTYLTPNNIHSLRCEAKKLKRLNNISHSEALFRISTINGFKNWKDLQNTYKSEQQYVDSFYTAFTGNIEKAERYLGQIFNHLKQHRRHKISLDNRYLEHSFLLSKEHIARKENYSSWEELSKSEQVDIKIKPHPIHTMSAIARNQNQSLLHIKNVIHIALEDKKHLHFYEDEFHISGLYEDKVFSDYIYTNDPKISEDPPSYILRLFGIDTTNYHEVYNYINNILSAKLNSPIGFYPSYVWINGAIDPNLLKPEIYYLDDYTNILNYSQSDPLPLPQTPTKYWKVGAK